MITMNVGDKKYNLVFNFTALKKLESLGVDLGKLDKGAKLSDISAMLYVGMHKFHKEVILEDVDNMLDELVEEKGFEQAMEYVADVIAKGLNGKK